MKQQKNERSQSSSYRSKQDYQTSQRNNRNNYRRAPYSRNQPQATKNAYSALNYNSPNYNKGKQHYNHNKFGQ